MSGFKTAVVLLVAVCLAHQAMCGKAPRGADAAETAPDAPTLQDVIARGKDTLQNVNTQVTQLLGLDTLPDSDKVAKVLTNQTQALSETIQSVIGNIDKEVKAHGGSFTGLLEAMSTRLSETVTHLQSEGAARDASEIQATITTSLNTVMEEAGKLATALGGEASTVQEDLAKLARTTVEQAVHIGKQVEDKVKTAIDENKAAAPHA